MNGLRKGNPTYSIDNLNSHTNHSYRYQSLSLIKRGLLLLLKNVSLYYFFYLFHVKMYCNGIIFILLWPVLVIQ